MVGGWIGSSRIIFPSASTPLNTFRCANSGMYLAIGSLGQPLAPFPKDYHGHAGYGLGHRKVAKDCVLGHRSATRHVAHSVGPVVDQFVVARQHGDDAGNLLLIHELLHESTKPVKALRGEPTDS